MEHSVNKQMGFLFCGRIISFVVLFTLPLVLVRVFSTEDFGLYKQLFLIHETIFMSLTVGVSASIFYFIPRYPLEWRVYLQQTFLVLGCLGALAAASLIATKSDLARFLNNSDLEIYVPYIAIYTGLSLLTTNFENIMIILKQSRLAASTIMLSDLLRAVLMIGAAIWTHSMLVLILSALIWMVVRFLVLLVYLRKLEVPVWITPDMDRLRELFRFAVPFGLGGICGILADSLPQYVISHLYTPAFFAIYSVGCLQIPITAIIFSSISDVTLVRLGELQKARNESESAYVIGDSVSKICLLLLPTYVWLMVNAKDVIVLLFTERFGDSVEIFRIFLSMIVLVALQLDYVPRAFGDIGFLLRVNILRLVLTATLLFFLVGPLGMKGAALATVMALAASKLIILFRVRTLLKVTLQRLLPWNQLVRISFASLAAGVAAGSFQMIGRFRLPIELFLSAIIFGTVYAVSVWKFSGIGADLKEWALARFKHWTRAYVGVT